MNAPVKDRSPLLPYRHPTPDIFVCDVFDAALKGDMASMEHPIFSLATKPDKRVRRYEHNGYYIEIKPSVDGLATVHDRDVLIYCISQVMSEVNNGGNVSRIIRFKAHDLLRATNRMTNGRGYEGLKAAFERLAGTRIATNIPTGNQEIYKNFGLIEEVTIVREARDGRMQEVEVVLCNWVINALEHNEVLTMSKDYFRLRKPIEKRLYEIGRKFCGRQAEWKISLELLQKKCGATSTLREFRRLVGQIVKEDEAHGHIPNYAVRMEGDDFVVFRNRGLMSKLPQSTPIEFIGHISGDGYEEARIAAPGWDVYEIEREWRAWLTEPPRNIDAAFVGFARKWFEKRGRPN